MNGAPAGDHYRRPGLTEAILAALNHDPATGPLASSRITALDQFHVGGGGATQRLADRAALVAGERVLDLGSGLGGPARLLADRCKVQVTGLDFSAEFCRAAACLGALTGQADSVAIVCADALQLPFGDACFDVVWTEHVAMNIADRPALYRECARVLRPGGRFALYDIVRADETGTTGTAEDFLFPVPWARTAAASYLLGAAALREALQGAGLTERVWADESAAAQAWLLDVTGRRKPSVTPPNATLRLVMGPDFPVMIANLRDNFIAGRVGAVQAVFVKA